MTEVQFKAFTDLLPPGHDIIIHRDPGGYTVDITPRFDDSGPVAILQEELDVAALEAFGDNARLVETAYAATDYQESAEYDTVALIAEGRINAQAVEKLIKIGVKPGLARELVSRKDPAKSKTVLRKIKASLRGRSTTVAKALTKRRRDLAEAEARAVGFSAELEANLQKQFPVWESRLAKAGVAVPADENLNPSVKADTDFRQLVKDHRDQFVSEPFSEAELAALHRPGFASWFAGSKINEGEVGDTGITVPAVAYHGSGSDINAFDTPTFFSLDSEVAAHSNRTKSTALLKISSFADSRSGTVRTTWTPDACSIVSTIFLVDGISATTKILEVESIVSGISGAPHRP